MLWEQDGVGMFVTPLPVVALLLTARFSPLVIVSALLLQVVAVSPFLALVPFMPVARVPVVVPLDFIVIVVAIAIVGV